MTDHARFSPPHQSGDGDRTQPSPALRHFPGIGRLPPRVYQAALMWIVLLLAAAVRAYGLTRQSAWADEITTLFITDPTLSFAQFWDAVLSDTHPPLYYLLMREWSAAFGQSDLAARLPSVIFGVLAVGAAAISFRPYPFRGRLALMSLLAASPGAIEYAQEARSYSLLLFLSTVITGYCFRFVSCRGQDGDRPIRTIVLLTMTGIVASYTHYFGFLLAAAAGFIACLAARGDRRRLAIAGIGLITLVAVFLPWVIYHARYMEYGLRMTAWIADFPAGAMVSWFIRLWLGGTSALIMGVTIATILLAIPSFRAFLRRDAAYGLGLALAFLTVAAALAISWHRPVLTSRNLIVILPALYLTLSSLAVYGVQRWGSLVTAACFLAQLLLMTHSLPGSYGVRTKEQWRESAAFVLAQPGCHKGPIHVYGETPNYRYLLEKARPDLDLIEIPLNGTAPAAPAKTSDCNVLFWAADLDRDRFDTILATFPVERSCIRVAEFYYAFVAWRDASASPGDEGCVPIPRKDGP